MKNSAALAAFVLAVLPCASFARPILIEEKLRIPNPDSATYPDLGAAAIEGDSILIAAHRIVPPDPDTDPYDYSRNMGVFAYRNVAGAWTLIGRISTADVYASNVFDYGLDIDNGIAALGSMPFQVYENNGGTWTRSTVDFSNGGTEPGRHVRVSSGRILLGGSQGTWHGAVWERDTAGVWRHAQNLLGEYRSGDDEQEGGPVDLFGNHAVIASPTSDDRPSISPSFLVFERRSDNSWGPAWGLHSPIDDSPYPAERFGEELSFNLSTLVVAGSVRTGSHLFRRTGSINAWEPAQRLQPLNSLMGGGPTWHIRNLGSLFLQLSTDPDRDVTVINVFGPNASNVYEHRGTLSGGL